MAHFAELDNNNTVLRVLVVPDEQEHRGQEFLADDLGLGGTWVQTSYNGRLRKQYAGVGYSYDANADVFIAPSPLPSWVLNENYDWVPPIPRPVDADEFTAWDETTLQWVSTLPYQGAWHKELEQ